MVNHGSRVIWICGSAQGGRGVPFRAGAMVYAGPARR
jgi:hypothetical protein